MATTTMVSAKALWWREADDCHCAEEFVDHCNHRPTAGWVDPLLIGEIDGWQYVTDRYLLLPLARIGGLPVGYATTMAFRPLPPQAVDGFATWLQSTVIPEPSSRLFAAPIIDPLEHAGFLVRPLEGVQEAHGICDPDLALVGVVMPLHRAYQLDPPPARVAA